MIPKFSIFGSILFGVPLVGASLFMGYQYFVADFTRELDRAELRFVTDEVVRIERVRHPKTAPIQQVWLRTSEHPFRFDESRVGHVLAPGTVIEVGLESSELASPHYASADGQHFYLPITAHIVGGSTILDLETYNSHMRSMRSWFPWLTLLIGLVGVFLSTRYAIEELARQRRPHPRTGRNEPLKFRLLKP